MDVKSLSEYFQLSQNVIGFLIIVLPILGGMLLWLYKIFSKITFLVRELTPNGGSSIRDAINRIEKHVKSIDFSQKVYFDMDTQMPMFQSDDSGHFIWVNEAFLNLLDCHLEDILGTSWCNHIYQLDRDKVRTEWELACVEQRQFDYTFRMVNKKSGDLIYVRCKSKGSRQTGFIGFFEKIFTDPKI